MDFLLLRLVLASSVAGAHFHALTGTRPTYGAGISSLLAVQAFFVVSGWIVTASYETSRSGKAFFIRRLARLYPLYVVVVLIQAAWVTFLSSGHNDLIGELARYLAANLTFMNFAKPTLLGFLDGARVENINPSLWTLKIEVLFYLTVPLWVAVWRRHRWWGLLGLYVASVIFASIADPYSHELARQLPGQLRFFVAGMICQRLVAKWDLAGVSRLWILPFAVVTFLLANRLDSNPMAYAIQPLLVGAMVVAATRLFPNAGRFPDISYGVYLIHAPAIQFAQERGWLAHSDYGFLSIIVATVVLAFVAHYVIEQPAIRAGRRWSDRISGKSRGASASTSTSVPIVARSDQAASHAAAPHPVRVLIHKAFRSVIAQLPDHAAVQILYLRRFGKFVDFDRPESMTEKINWRKLRQRDPRFRAYSDKIAVKTLVAEAVGSQHVIPTLWTGDSPDDIPFDALVPPYVIKTSHDSNSALFVREPADVDVARFKKSLARQLAKAHAHVLREWGYEGIPRRILVERMLVSDDGKVPADFKFFVYDGQARFVQYDNDRFGHHTRAFLDMDWQRVPAQVIYPQYEGELPRPPCFDAMRELAGRIGKGFDFVRVDLYEVDGAVYFGEATFYPGGGVDPFIPKEWDYEFGKYWRIPSPKAVSGARPFEGSVS